MKKKMSRRLTLHRETIQRLDEPALRGLAGGGYPLSDTECPQCPNGFPQPLPGNAGIGAQQV